MRTSGLVVDKTWSFGDEQDTCLPCWCRLGVACCLLGTCLPSLVKSRMDERVIVEEAPLSREDIRALVRDTVLEALRTAPPTAPASAGASAPTPPVPGE